MKFDWKKEDSNGVLKSAAFAHEGFSCIIQIMYDYDHDWTGFLGTFSDNDCEGAVPNPRAEFDHGICKFFLPDYTVQERYVYLMECDPASGPDSNLAKAQEQVNEELLIAADPEGQGYFAVGIECRMFLKGVELGSAFSFGYEITSIDDPELDTVSDYLVREASDKASKKLQELKEV